MDVEDCLQESRLAVLQAIDRWYPSRAALSAWLTLCIDRHPGQLKRRADPPCLPLDLERDGQGQSMDPEAVALARVHADALLDRCRSLVGDPTDQVILQFLSEGHRQPEIARLLGCQPSSVQRRGERVRAHLSHHLKEDLS